MAASIQRSLFSWVGIDVIFEDGDIGACDRCGAVDGVLRGVGVEVRVMIHRFKSDWLLEPGVVWYT